ncbi:hypothetical protein ACFVVQ_12165 [Paenibacillus chitinolyticus]|uniref:hypothetical protein n=1 Tax=Paenibacillus chitinolyticus TaxID=79263 RepID=UPI0036DBDE48
MAKTNDNNEVNLEAQIAREEKNMRQILDDMKKVSIEIPEDNNNPDDVVPVVWNGVVYAIPRGIRFEVPEAIYETWKYSHEKTKEVDRRIKKSTQTEIKIM